MIDKIKFYSLGSNKIDISKVSNKEEIDFEKPIVITKEYNDALKNVIEKDITFLKNKLNKVLKKANQIFDSLSINTIIDEPSLDEIQDIITEIENNISNIINTKNEIKVGVFSINKKEKKQKIKSTEDIINKLTSLQNELIAIKNEYDKLKNRKSLVNDDYEKEDEGTNNDNPLERTINFYLKHKN